MIPYKKPEQGTSCRTLFLVVILALSLVGLTGCGEGLPDRVREQAKAIPDNLDAAQKQVDSQKTKFASLKGKKTFKPMADYAAKEKWDSFFDQANTTLTRARDLNDKELAPLVKKNDPQTANRVMIETKRVSQIIQEARHQAKAPFNRMARIQAAMDDTANIRSVTQKSAKKIQDQIQSLMAGPVAQARGKFPDSAPAIDARVAPFLKMDQDTTTRLAAVEKEYKAHAAGQAVNYAAFITNADAITRDFTDLNTSGPKLEKDIGLLYQSYTKVLQDMKEDYFITVKRESWDERSDYYNPKSATFQRQVTPAVYQALAETELESIADLTPGFSGLGFKNNIGDSWKALGINPTENWPDRSHNAANFWVENAKETYFHKYLKEENGESTETGWEKVNASFYDQNLENLGMAILSKPYGQFEPDAQAAPPGMAYVGNSEYGEWKKDEQGTSFWSWYGRYAFFSHMFFFPPSYYHYGSWNRWNNNYRSKKPYYGKNKNGKPKYGTRGSFTKNTPRYQNTTFSKTGGLKSRPASVRGGGSSLRGGGPKSKGK